MNQMQGFRSHSFNSRRSLIRSEHFQQQRIARVHFRQRPFGNITRAFCCMPRLAPRLLSQNHPSDKLTRLLLQADLGMILAPNR